MLTAFGKFTRKLRIDKGELLKDMADKLQVTSSYLSSVEMGKRTVPQKWAEQIKEFYTLTESDYLDLLKSISESKKEVVLNLSEKNAKDKDIILSFARNFDDLDDVKKAKIRELLK